MGRENVASVLLSCLWPLSAELKLSCLEYQQDEMRTSPCWQGEWFGMSGLAGAGSWILESISASCGGSSGGFPRCFFFTGEQRCDIKIFSWETGVDLAFSNQIQVSWGTALVELLALKPMHMQVRWLQNNLGTASAPFPVAFSEHPCELRWILEPAACPGWQEVCTHLGTALMAPQAAEAAWGLKALSPPDFVPSWLPAVPEARGTLMSLPLTIAETEANYRWCLGYRIIKLIRKMQPSSCEDVVFCSWWDCVLPAAFVHCPETARKAGKNILLEKEPA